MQCIEFPSILRACAALMAFDTIFFMCSTNFRWGLNQTPRYFIRGARDMVFVWPSLSVGMVTLGLFLALWPVLVLVKCQTPTQSSCDLADDSLNLRQAKPLDDWHKMLLLFVYPYFYKHTKFISFVFTTLFFFI